MQAYDIVREYYTKYGKDTAGCAAEFLEKNCGRSQAGHVIKKIAVYYPVMSHGGVQRVISLLFPVYRSLHCEVVLITEKISDDDYDVPECVKRFCITDENRALADHAHFSQRYCELEKILQIEGVDLFLHHGVRQMLFVYDIIVAKSLGIYVAAEKHQVFTQGFCDINDLFWVHLPAFQILDGLVVLSTLEELYWKTFGINAFYIENPFNGQLEIGNHDRHRDSISWAGRLDIYSKQYFDVLDIAEIVKRTHPKVKFKMYGSGSNAQICDLLRCIEDRGLGETVYFCGYEADIAKLYKDTKVQLVTSAYEGFPMVMYESKILGIPLVTYDLPYLELLRNGLGYLSVINGDVKAAAESICKILDCPELEEKLSTEAKISIQDFNNEKVGQKWAQFFCRMEEHSDMDTVNTPYRMILETMHRHYAVAQKKYERLKWDFSQTVVSYHARKGMRDGRKLVLCPFGVVGKRVKEMLNEQGILETYIIDNGLAQERSDILSMTDLKSMDCSNFIFMICCENEDLKDTFYSQLTEIAGEEQIVYYDAKLD